jgi:hypothetical protein
MVAYSTLYPFAAKQVSLIALMLEIPCSARAWSLGLWGPGPKGKGVLWL